MNEVTIVRTGTANLASVVAAFERIGTRTRFTESPGDIDSACRLVLPGVGSFGAAAANLRALGLDRPLRTRIAARRPTLAICLGLQLLAERSDECLEAAGLRIWPCRVTRFSGLLRVPQLGWNRVSPSTESCLIEPGYAYFANSYRLESAPPGWTPATSDHGGPFVAALEDGAVLACQFHPELSGEWGSRLLRRWVSASKELSC